MKNFATEQALLPLIEAIEGTPVLIIGDVMLDRFVYGHVDRISPESPVPVLAIKREDTMLGGAGNALANLAGLEAKGYFISVIGNDTPGQQIKTHIEKLGFDGNGLIVDQTRPTTIKTRFLAGHQQLLRSDFEYTDPISDAVMLEVLKKFEDIIRSVKCVIISDYGKGLLRPDLIKQIITIAQKNNIPVIVDPKGQDFSIYKGASAVTPNKKELSYATRDMPVHSDETVIAAAQKIIKECGIDTVIATRSAEGISVIQAGQEPVHFKGADIEVFDVSGAGDSVIATVGAALAAGGKIEEAAALANIAGSIVVTKVGTAAIRSAELSKAIKDNHLQQARCSRKGDILDWPAAAEQVRRWKARGLRVGFTNGCFDILHKGHVSYLNNTRDHCDRLIVGLNHDASVKILKGPERPVHDEQARAEVLAALGAVDLVVLFGAEKQGEDNTANKLLALLQPDLYFKGGDYTEDQIPEAPAVKAYGGHVKIMPVYEGHSTTSSIAKMKTGAG